MNENECWRSTATLSVAAMLLMAALLVWRETQHQREIREAVIRERNVPIPNELNQPFDGDDNQRKQSRDDHEKALQ